MCDSNKLKYEEMEKKSHKAHAHFSGLSLRFSVYLLCTTQNIIYEYKILYLYIVHVTMHQTACSD